jgi:glycosyltransferase involved in cell wall biosynthesis
MTSSLIILHTESHRQWGGQEMRVFHEGRWMRRKGHQVILAAPGDTPLYERARADGWETHPVAFTRLSMAGDFFKIRALLKQVRPHVLNTHGNTDGKAALAAAWGLDIPCVIRSRHYTAPVRNSWYNRLLYQKLCHCVFTTAGSTTTQLVQDLGIPQDRCMTLPTGIAPPSDLPDRDTARQSLARELGLGPDARFIGFVGRLSPDKGLSIFIQAFAAIRDAIPSHHIVLIGIGSEREALEHLAQTLGLGDRVHFTGYVENPWPYFRALDCHVIASLKYEGVPQTLLQAMFAQCPVVGTEIGGIREVITHENTGILVPPDNAQALADAILTLLKNSGLSQSLVQKALDVVTARYTLDAMGERILEIYERIMPDPALIPGIDSRH